MRRILFGAVLLSAGVFTLPLFAQKEPDKKDPDKKDPVEVKKDEKKESLWKPANPGTVIGKLAQYDEGKKHIKLKVPVQVLDQNEANALAQAQQRLAQHQGEFAKANQNDRNNAANNIMNAQRDIATHQAKLYKTETKDMEWDAVDDVHIRLNNPPTKFNEKGDIVKPDKKELEEMKGPDKTLPGYTGEASDLRTDRPVQVTLVILKEIPAEIKNKKPNERTEDDKKLLQPHVSIILVAEPPQPGTGPGGFGPKP